MLNFALLTLQVAVAEEVLVPAFTPRTISDIAAAEFVTNEAVRALRLAGLDVRAPDALAARAGEAAQGCAEQARCPGNLWPLFPEANVAVVGLIWASPGGLQIEAQLYRPDERSPVETLQMAVADGAEAAFATRLAERVKSWSVVPLPPPPEPEPQPPAPAPVDPYAILDPYTGQPVPPREANPVSYPYTYEAVTAAPPTAPAAPQPAAPEPEVDEPPPRGARTGLELYLGPAFGDVDRRYDVRAVIIEDGDDRALDGDPYQYETWRNSAAFSAGLQVTHAVLPWIEATLGAGLQVGHVELNTGWEIQDPSGEVLSSGHDPLQTGSTLSAVIEPGVRGYPLPDAIVAPYGLARLTTRLRGPIEVPTSRGIDWPDARGGLDIGGSFGLGLASGSTEHLSLFLEIPWTVWATAGAERRGGESLVNVPPQATPVGQGLEIRAGAGWRF